MKFGRFSLFVLKQLVKNDIKKRRKNYPPHSFRERINIPYVNDNNVHHTYDVYLANEENRKHCCIIDIHGGSYIFGEHKDNYPFGYTQLENGYDVVLIDYIPNDGKHDISDIFNDVILNIRHLVENLQEYGLENDTFIIAGDSAGGHLALLLSEVLVSEKVREELGIEPINLKILGTVVNSPVYDYASIANADGPLSKAGMKRLLGPRYVDEKWLKKYSPNTHINELNIPIFLSTCKNDFIRPQSLLLYEELKSRKDFVYLDIDSDDKQVGHVHNVINIELEESKQVNNAISEFINNLLK